MLGKRDNHYTTETTSALPYVKEQKVNWSAFFPLFIDSNCPIYTIQ